MSKVDEALVEVRAARAVLGPELQGLREIERTLVDAGETDAKLAIRASIAQYQERDTLLVNAEEALDELAGHLGYPSAIPVVLPQAEFDVTQKNLSDIDAARARIVTPTEPEATGGTASLERT